MDEGEVVLESFSEAEARVEDDAFGGDARLDSCIKLPFEEGADFAGHLFVGGSLLHGSGRALHVHEDDTTRGSGDNFQHRRIGLEGTDVVDNIRAESERLAGHFGFGGVDGNESLGFWAKSLQDGEDAAKFFVDWNRFRAGSRGFSAQIENSGSLGNKVKGAGDSRFHRGMESTVRKGIGGEIEHPHEDSVLREVKLRRGAAPDKAGVAGRERNLLQGVS